MVLTRNQKRNNEEDEEIVIGGGDNIAIVKKKRKNGTEQEKSSSTNSTNINGQKSSSTSTDWIDSDSSIETEKQPGHDHDDDDEDEESTAVETSNSETGEIWDSEANADDECTVTESNESENIIDLDKLEANGQGELLNMKIKRRHIDEIIKGAIKTLVRQYDSDTESNKEETKKLTKQQNEEYNKFTDFIESIYDGEFFKRVPLEERKRKLKAVYTPEQIKQMNEELDKINKKYRESAPSVLDILNMNVSIEEKQKLLEKVHHLFNSDILSNEYNVNLKYLNTNIKDKSMNEDLQALEKDIVNHVSSSGMFDNYKTKILKSDMSFYNKVIAYQRLQIMESYEESDSSEYAKYKNWMDILLSVPFGKYIEQTVNSKSSSGEIKDYMKQIRIVLDKNLSFLENPKDQIINVVSQMLRNEDAKMNAIALWGSKGTGKTSIIKSISEALGRPYRTISLGGESDASILTGHNFTYVGSIPGRIVEILRETNCMNPVILIDELDKISTTNQGREIIGNLIHLTDSTTNNRYNYDRYFSGLEFDLSKVLFVFTYNDPESVDKILADRLFKIKVNNYSYKEKLEITKRHLIKNVLTDFKFNTEDILFHEDALVHIVNSSKGDEGMRDIKRKIEIIVSRINTLLLTNPEDNIIRLKYNSLYQYYKELPVTVLKEHVDILLHDSINTEENDDKPPHGMYI